MRCLAIRFLIFSETTIGDIWRKPRGRVEPREGGGLACGGGQGGEKMQTTVIEQL